MSAIPFAPRHVAKRPRLEHASDEKPADEALSPTAEEEADARFNGDGLTAEEQHALDFVDKAAQTETDATAGSNHASIIRQFDALELKATMRTLEQATNHNQNMRASHVSEPERFLESEFALNSAIEACSRLAESPALYIEAADDEQTGLVALLVALTAHENIDICATAVRSLTDLLEEDVTPPEQALRALLDALARHELLLKLSRLFARLFKGDGIIDDTVIARGALDLIDVLIEDEALCSQAMMTISGRLIAIADQYARSRDERLLETALHATETLATLLQTSKVPARAAQSENLVETLLETLARWRKVKLDKHSPNKTLVTDLANCLCSLVMVRRGKDAFFEAEGTELMELLMRDSQSIMAQIALKVLGHACTPFTGSLICQRLVDAGTLPHLEMLLLDGKMGAPSLGHVISIVASLLKYLASDDVERAALIDWLNANGGEKVQLLLTLRAKNALKVKRLRKEQQDTRAKLEGGDKLSTDERAELDFLDYSARLGAGLDIVQDIDVTCAWLLLEETVDAKTKEMIRQHRPSGSKVFVRTLKELKVVLQDTVKRTAVDDTDANMRMNEDDDELEGIQVELDIIDTLVEALAL
ncbi:hypothetical protein PYCC9005_004556 [Savitreella phatthalungensis]